MSSPSTIDARFLAQERIVDALLRALALRQPDLLDTMREILVDTEFTHSGKPKQEETAHQQIRKRLELASEFAEKHGSELAASSRQSIGSWFIVAVAPDEGAKVQ